MAEAKRTPASKDAGPIWSAGLRAGWLAAAAAAGSLLAASALAATAPGPEGAVPAGLQLAAVVSAPDTTVRFVEVRRGGTLEGTLRGAGAGAGETAEAIRAIERLFDPRGLMPGQTVEIRFTGDSAARLWSVRLPLGEHRGVVAVAAADGAFVARTYDPVGEEEDIVAAGPLLWVEGGVTERALVVRRGQTLMTVAVAMGAGRVEADDAIRALSRLFNPRRLQIGQTVTVTFGDGGRLLGFTVSVDDDLEVAAFRSEGGDFLPLRTTRADRERFVAEAQAAREAAGAPVAATAAAAPMVAAVELDARTGTVRKGDTLLEVAMRLGARGGNALTASQALSSVFNLRMLKAGHVVTAVMGRRAGDEATRLLALSINVGTEREVVALLSDDGTFEPLRTTPGERERMVAVYAAPVYAAPEPAASTPTPSLTSCGQRACGATELQLAVTEEPWTGPTLPGFDHTTVSLIVTRGDTLMEAAKALGAGNREAYDATQALADIFNPRRLRVGQVITATFGRVEEGAGLRLLALAVAVDAQSEAAAFLSEGGGYTPRRLSKAEADRMIAALALQSSAIPIAPQAPPPPPPPPEFDWVATIDRTVPVNTGDTLMEAVMSAGATANDAYEAIQALTGIFNPRRLRAGQSIKITFAKDDSSGWDSRLLAVNVAIDVDREVAALRAPDGVFSPHEIWKPLDVRTVRAEGSIEDSLFLSAERAGVPMNILMEMIRIYSWDVDFQRDIQAGDSFQVFFERLHDDAGEAVKEGDILHASMTLSGRELRLYRYETQDGIIDYYNEEGHSVRKALLRTPVDGARLSSGFGMRMHPILGYSRMHQGIDFAAPSGTPIRAAGDGVIELAGVNNGYGNYVRIRHNSDYKTAYAHLSRFASGIHPGVRVRQGQTIGYVGSSGLATGPHLHYEVMRNNAQVNPMSIRLPTGKRLEGLQLAGFEYTRDTIDRDRGTAPFMFAVADAE